MWYAQFPMGFVALCQQTHCCSNLLCLSTSVSAVLWSQIHLSAQKQMHDFCMNCAICSGTSCPALPCPALRCPALPCPALPSLLGCSEHTALERQVLHCTYNVPDRHYPACTRISADSFVIYLSFTSTGISIAV